jgi:hypothetical protein
MLKLSAGFIQHAPERHRDQLEVGRPAFKLFFWQRVEKVILLRVASRRCRWNPVLLLENCGPASLAVDRKALAAYQLCALTDTLFSSSVPQNL